MAEYPQHYERIYNFRSDNTWSEHKSDINKVWKHDMFETENQISKSESFRCVNRKPVYPTINLRRVKQSAKYDPWYMRSDLAQRQFAERRENPRSDELRLKKSDKERVMNDIWKHDMFEINEREIARSEQWPKNLGHEILPVELFISNIDQRTTELDLSDLFSVIGRLIKISLHYDTSGRSLGTAIVSFSRKVDAVEATKKYNGERLDGKTLKIQLLSSSNDKRSRYARQIRPYKTDDRIDKHDTSTQGTLMPHCEDFGTVTGYFNNMNIN